MYYSASNCASTLSSEKEVFRREALETKVKEGMDEKRGKQKRRDRVSKAKAQSAKSKLPKTGGDVLAQIKSKENIVAPNSGTQRITVSRDNVPALFTQKIGIYNKGKSSLMVSRRRPLHDIQLSQKTIQDTEKDLKRVLGYSKDGNSPVKSSPHLSRGKNSPMATGGQPPEEPKQSSSEMELSPDKPGAVSDDDSLLCIAGRIAEGLHPCMVYPDTDYLSTVKAELRKLLKQGNSGDQSHSQTISTGMQPDMETVTGPSEYPATDSVSLLDPVTGGSSDTFFSIPLFDDQDRLTQAGSDRDGYDFRLDMLRSAVFEPASAASHAETGQRFDLTEVELAPLTYDPSYPTGPTSVDGASAGYQMELPSSPQVVMDPPRDFLDLLDTMQQENTGEQPNSLSRPPGSKWMPTPERPLMFPQKLY